MRRTKICNLPIILVVNKHVSRCKVPVQKEINDEDKKKMLMMRGSKKVG